MATAALEYLETKVLTATPYQLHLIVVDGALREAAAAEHALASKNFEAAHQPLDRARQFVAEMISGLDAKKFPELVAELESFFLFIHRALVTGELQRNRQLVADAIRLLKLHRETWLALGERLTVSAPGTPSGSEDAEYSWRQ